MPLIQIIQINWLRMALRTKLRHIIVCKILHALIHGPPRSGALLVVEQEPLEESVCLNHWRSLC